MSPFAAALFVLDAVFWLFLIAVGVVFVSALIRETIEDIRDHHRIVATRIALSALPPPSAWEGTMWLELIRGLRRSLYC